MANEIHFEDNRIQVTAALEEAVIAYLHEATGELLSQVQRNTAVDTGQLKGSWNTVINESALSAQVGSPLENAIWEEFGTGEYALNGDGRSGSWSYEDINGDWHKTKGKHPRRALNNAFVSKKTALQRRFETVVRGRME